MKQLEPGKFYHLYTRGNNKETLFRHPDSYRYFLQLYRKYVAPYADTFAYCLLPNHVHFLVRIKEEDALIAEVENRRQQDAGKYKPATRAPAQRLRQGHQPEV